MVKRTRRGTGGDTIADKLSLGYHGATSPGRSPGEEAAKGVTISKSPGRSPAEESAEGAPLAARGMKRGGHMDAYKKAHKQVRSLYKMLHSHFAGDSEPEIAKKRGGKLWIQNAIKNKGALHKSLHVPEGKKIPLSKLHKAEHSKSPTLRKRARLAETLRGFHHRSQGR